MFPSMVKVAKLLTIYAYESLRRGMPTNLIYTFHSGNMSPLTLEKISLGSIQHLTQVCVTDHSRYTTVLILGLSVDGMIPSGWVVVWSWKASRFTMSDLQYAAEVGVKLKVQEQVF